MAHAPEQDEPRDDGRISATNARQGVTNHRVRWVLAISMVLVILAFVVTFFLS